MTDTTHIQTGSWLTPRLEHARVADGMRHGVLSCPANSSLRDAARTMSQHHVHMVVVTDPSDGSPVGAISDTELVDALLAPPGGLRALGDVARKQVPSVSSGEPLSSAVRQMREEGADHLLVRDASSGRPVGVLSALDVAGILAWGEA